MSSFVLDDCRAGVAKTSVRPPQACMCSRGPEQLFSCSLHASRLVVNRTGEVFVGIYDDMDLDIRMEVAGLQPKIATPNMARAELLRLNRRSIQERYFHYSSDNDAGACYSLYSLSSTRVNLPIYLRDLLALAS